MELLKLTKSRSKLSDIAYVALNLALAVVLLASVLSVQSIWLPLLIVLLGKWRIFAVRPRYWYANLISNMVDIIVGVSHVVFLYAATGSLWFQIFLTVGFIVWLLFVKPRSKRLFVTAQAAAATFVGTTALSMVAYDVDVTVFVIGMFVIGYSAARHVLTSYEDNLNSFLSMVWGVVLAEIGWIGYHWLFAYTIPNTGDFKLVQLALIVTVLSFLAERAIHSRHKHGVINRAEMIMPAVFSGGLILVLLIFFNNLSAGGSI